jgi:predicted MFS family arabinose efflux permease
MTSAPKINPHDIGLPPAAVRKRRHSHRLATIMLTIAVITAAAGWFVYITSVVNAIRIKDQPPSLALVAYGRAIANSLVLPIA